MLPYRIPQLVVFVYSPLFIHPCGHLVVRGSILTLFSFDLKLRRQLQTNLCMLLNFMRFIALVGFASSTRRVYSLLAALEAPVIGCAAVEESADIATSARK
jgi:hypothetical protein